MSENPQVGKTFSTSENAGLSGLSCLTGDLPHIEKRHVYSLSDAPIAGEKLLRWEVGADVADIERGNGLAAALGGRWVRASHGWHIRPRYAACWVALFAAGFCARRYGYGGGMYSFYEAGNRKPLGLWAAMRKAKP